MEPASREKTTLPGNHARNQGSLTEVVLPHSRALCTREARVLPRRIERRQAPIQSGRTPVDANWATWERRVWPRAAWSGRHQCVRDRWPRRSNHAAHGSEPVHRSGIVANPSPVPPAKGCLQCPNAGHTAGETRGGSVPAVAPGRLHERLVDAHAPRDPLGTPTVLTHRTRGTHLAGKDDLHALASLASDERWSALADR